MPLRFRIRAADPGTAAGEPAPSAERAVDVSDGISEIHFGRRSGAEVELPYPALSSSHARLVRSGAGWRLEDLGSMNGTAIEGRHLTPGVGQPLEPGQTFHLAHVAILFEGPVAAARAGEGTGSIARRLVSDLFALRQDAGVPQVIVLDGPAAGRSLRLQRLDHLHTVGRAPTCDLPLEIEEISREHAGFIRRPDGVFVRDLGSKNGITIDGLRLAGDHRLRDGDRIDLGAAALCLEDPEDRYLREMQEAAAPVAARTSPPMVPLSLPRPLSLPGAAATPRPTRTTRRTRVTSRRSTLPMTVALLVLFGVAALLGVLFLAG